MENEKPLTAADVTGATQQLLEKIVTGLADAVRIRIDRTGSDTESRMIANEPHFFPNGIELIRLVVRAGTVDCELTIAGGQSTLATPMTTGADHLTLGGDTNVPVHQGGVGYRGHVVTWYHPACPHASVNFMGPSPFGLPGFPVLTPPGVSLRVTGPAGSYLYHWECHTKSAGTEGEHILGGNARIQII